MFGLHLPLNTCVVSSTSRFVQVATSSQSILLVLQYMYGVLYAKECSAIMCEYTHTSSCRISHLESVFECSDNLFLAMQYDIAILIVASILY